MARRLRRLRRLRLLTTGHHSCRKSGLPNCRAPNFFLDDEVLLAAGVRDFARYDVQAGAALQADFFVEALPGMLPADNMIKPEMPS
jgi:hypothetical protein